MTAEALTLARRASQRRRRDPMIDLRLTRPQRQWIECTHPRAVWRDGNRLGKSWAQAADLVLFDPDAPFVLDRFALRSKSKNTPFDGQRMEGRVIGTWVGGRRVFDRYAA